LSCQANHDEIALRIVNGSAPLFDEAKNYSTSAAVAGQAALPQADSLGVY
jgi:hypothetical protein